MADIVGIKYISNNLFNNSVVDLYGGGATADVIGFNLWGGHNQKVSNVYIFFTMTQSLTRDISGTLCNRRMTPTIFNPS